MSKYYVKNLDGSIQEFNVNISEVDITKLQAKKAILELNISNKELKHSATMNELIEERNNLDSFITTLLTDL